MKLLYITSREENAIRYYRQILPSAFLKKYSNIKATEFKLGDLGVLAELTEDADVILMQGVSDKQWIDYGREMQSQYGKKIVVDVDDNFFEVNPLSPHYKDFGTSNYSWMLPDGKEARVWQEGRNLDIKKNLDTIERFKDGLRMADMVTVTTDILADLYRPYNANIRALPNCIDMTKWQRLNLKPHNGIRMGWFGGYSHYEDWLILKDVIPEVLKKHRDVTLVLMGTIFRSCLKGVNPDQIEFHSWVHSQAYPYKAAILDLDFAVIPLKQNAFNICKSPIKWCEMGALKVPCVTSYVSPYKEVATQDNGVWIVGNSKNAWMEGIEAMINRRYEEMELGENAYQTVMDKFDIEGQYHLWQEAYESLSLKEVAA